jgi:methylmalonyl-CoA mutase
VLLEESNLARVADPAAGSGSIEDLTAQLCTAAWSLFQDIEKQGGIWEALETNLLWQKIAAVREARAADIARRKAPLTGISEFPNIHELPADVARAAPVPVPAMPPATITFDALAPMRLATPFEALRDASDAILARTGARPRVFLANIGKAVDFTERATFAKNLFEAGGIEAVDYDPSRKIDLAAAFTASGAKLACLCSTDAIYGKEAEAAAKALAGAMHIYLAGRPGDHEAAYKAAGIGTFIHAGIDVLATLKAAHDMLNQARIVSP